MMAAIIIHIISKFLSIFSNTPNATTDRGLSRVILTEVSRIGQNGFKELDRYDLYSVVHNRIETGAQGVSYTTGVPAMIGAMMFLTGKWKKPGVYNVEEFDPDPLYRQPYPKKSLFTIITTLYPH